MPGREETLGPDRVAVPRTAAQGARGSISRGGASAHATAAGGREEASAWRREGRTGGRGRSLQTPGRPRSGDEVPQASHLEIRIGEAKTIF